MEDANRHAGWLRSPMHDLVLAFAWVPFALLAHLAAGRDQDLRWVVAATLLFSFAHQPLSLWLAYGDADQFRRHRSLFTYAPPVALVTVALASSLGPALVALVAGAWNLVHTIRQRYGIARLYGRLDGVGSPDDHRLLWSWVALAILGALATADLGATAQRVGLGARNTAAVEALDGARPAVVGLLPLAAVVAAGLTIRTVRAGRRTLGRSPGRQTYLVSTAILLAVLAVEPVSGFVGYVGGHAAEYLLVVRWRIDRAAARAAPGDRVGALGRAIGGSGSLAVYASVVVALLLGLRAVDGTSVALVATLTLGALHFVFDGVLWRSPKTVPVPADQGL